MIENQNDYEVISLLNFNDKNFISSFFNDGGYVLSFSNSKFDDFTLSSVGTPIQTRYGLSKGKSFSAFIKDADDEKIIKLVSDLIAYIDYKDLEEILPEEKLKTYPKLKALMSRFSSNNTYSTAMASSVKENFNDSYIANQLKIMMSLVDESPSDVIGKSKEILESCFKYILDEFGEGYSSSATIAQLRKQAFVKLNLDPKENISAKNNDDVKRILNSFIQVVDGLNSLRNDKGTGHGKEPNYKELPARYAKLAMNASFTIVQFTWDTYRAVVDE